MPIVGKGISGYGIDNTHGFVIDLDKSDIREMDFIQVTDAIRNVDLN